ncbi:MAG: tetratricopeptide repeat protein [Pseudomonadota bacterium]|jgi:hypothetical protein|nr:tetratricopeptide repeat protein [Rubrivivax sp.]MCA3259553.1 tetratricopeptide repeat protein [Rubrivivax sp.]MCE2912087.1 tetratricopeptide repeat protein [Rubrivivax sp.]MCZ8030759.1 tetratricopeptide repeat protein [Rubrivivax sp.]
MLHDQYGNPVSTDDPADIAALDLFIDEVLGYGDRAGTIIESAQAAPGCALVNACAATLMMFMETGSACRLARPFLDAALAAPPATERERLHLRAVQAWVEGRMEVAVGATEQIVAAHPRDLLALKLGQTHRLLLGDFEGMRRMSATALSACREVGFVHGMHAFALEQCHRVSEAEQAALHALAIRREDRWAQHAYAHAQETQGRLDEGIRFLREHADTWTDCNSFMLTHNWWHLALFHLDRDEAQQALALYDQRVWGVWKEYSQDQINAVALLARLELRGVDVGDRWAELSGFLRARVDESVWPFNELHYLYGLARAGDTAAVQAKLQRLQADAAAVDPYVRRTWQQVALPAARGLCAAGQGRHAEAVDQLKPVMARMQEVGGSHAQRDLFELVFLDALERKGELPRARAMAEKRIIDRRNVAWQHRLLARLH